ncbi:MAG TPA: RDD family protein [Steroidobacteraceae bacterium]|nr:RDD family protein [Steroidobacteraceae bacterium]
MPRAGPPAGELEYVGFWLRVVAACVDTLWLTPIIVLLGFVFEHANSALTDVMLRDPASVSVSELAAALAPTPVDFVVSYVLPAVLVVLFWRRRSATPGKMLIRARIVDAGSGAAPSTRQLVVRYLGYFVSTIPLLLGLLWVGWDPRKQGWHDKLAGTVVVRPKLRPSAHVVFPGQEPQ